MSRSVSLRIAWAGIRAQRRRGFVSFISLMSVLGIALGVAVLITVLSVMNGFDQQIKQRIFGVARQVSILPARGVLKQWHSLQHRIDQRSEVVASAPFVDGQGIMTAANGAVQGVALMGISPKAESAVSIISHKMVQGRLQLLDQTHFGIVLGARLAEHLGVGIGDQVNVIVPQFTLTPAGDVPRSKHFTVQGIFEVGNGLAYDNQLALINLTDAQKLFQLGQAISGLRLKLEDLYLAPHLAQQLTALLGGGYLVRNWTQDFGNFFSAIKLEKNMMFLILTLLVAIAAFNLLATLVMVVNEKRASIAILRTFGATPGLICRIFIVQGCLIGLLGTGLGVLGGWLLASHVTEIVNTLQSWFHVKFLSASLYFVDYLPSSIHWQDIALVSMVAFLLAMIATLYPAWRAAHLPIVEALRDE